MLIDNKRAKEIEDSFKDRKSTDMFAVQYCLDLLATRKAMRRYLVGRHKHYKNKRVQAEKTEDENLQYWRALEIECEQHLIFLGNPEVSNE